MLILSLLTLFILISSLSAFAQAPALVPQTSQTSGWDPPTNAAGDDGDLKKGVPWPTYRVTDNGDGTVTDNLSGLVWLKDDNRLGGKTWSDALAACSSLEDDGSALADGSSVGDWRLPNLKELESLLDLSTYGPALTGGHPFINVQSGTYGSSNTSQYTNEDDQAWWVDLFFGRVNKVVKNSTTHVWPVRDQIRPRTPAEPLPDTGQTK
jgi:hypothetical protein